MAVTSERTARSQTGILSAGKNLSILQPANGDAEVRRKAWADSLIGTRHFPPYFTAIRMMALEALAYHNMRPYPYWAFSDWKIEDRGKLPNCLPLCRRIVNRSAKWLFGKPVEISLPGNETLEKFLREAWQLNRMPTKMVAAAEKGGIEGGVVLKMSYDEKEDVPLRFQVLSPITECRLFYDPHDADCLLMARIQYPVFNPQDGDHYMYREEWTAEWEVHYEPQPMKMSSLYPFTSGGFAGAFPVGEVPVISGTKTEPDLHEWRITTKTRNRFGVIPLHHVRNAEALSTYGRGDLWSDVTGGIFRLVDRINLAYQGMDRNNQMYADPVTVFIDAKVAPDVVNRPLRAGENLDIKSEESFSTQGAKQAKVETIEFDGSMRPHMVEFALAIKQEILDTVGSVDVDTSEVGNKGNLTDAVLTQLWLPLIQTTEEKRKTYGEDGICKFLELCAIGLSNLGAKQVKGVDAKKLESHDVKLKWSDYFPMDDEEKSARFTRLDLEVQGGYLPLERAVESVLQMEGVEDIPKAKKELEGVHEQIARQKEAEVSQAEADVEVTKNPPAAAGGKAGAGQNWRSRAK